MVIEWANGRIPINSTHLYHLLLTIKEHITFIVVLTFTNIYRDLNTEADKLSKLVLTLPLGLTKVE